MNHYSSIHSLLFWLMLYNVAKRTMLMVLTQVRISKHCQRIEKGKRMGSALRMVTSIQRQWKINDVIVMSTWEKTCRRSCRQITTMLLQMTGSMRVQLVTVEREKNLVQVRHQHIRRFLCVYLSFFLFCTELHISLWFTLGSEAQFCRLSRCIMCSFCLVAV